MKNYNLMSSIVVNIVDNSSNLVIGRYPCNDYEIHAEYLTTDASTFNIQDLHEDNVKTQNRTPLTVGKSYDYQKPKLGDYLYVTKCDGSDIIPLRTSAFYVGVITNIEGGEITAKHILTLLDKDSVIDYDGVFPYYDWTTLRGGTVYQGSLDDSSNPTYALLDCNTILSLVRSMEYALGQTPKLMSYPYIRMNDWGTTFDMMLYTAIPSVYWNKNNSLSTRGRTAPATGYANTLDYDSHWWSNGKKEDILIDCPMTLMGLGMHDPDYMFDATSLGIYHSKVTVDGGTTYYGTKRKDISQADLPGCYGGLGNGSKQIESVSLWSRLKQWYDDKHVMVIPVIYDNNYNSEGLLGSTAPLARSATIDRSWLYRVSKDYNTPNTSVNVNTIYTSSNENYKFDFAHTTASGGGWVKQTINLMNSQNNESIKAGARYADMESMRVIRNFTNMASQSSGSQPFLTKQSTSKPLFFASIGFKIVAMDYDHGYRIANELFRINTTTRNDLYGLYNVVPTDPISKPTALSSAEAYLPRSAATLMYSPSTTGLTQFELNRLNRTFPYQGFYAFSITDAYSKPPLEYDDAVSLAPIDQLSWCLRIDESDPYISGITSIGRQDNNYDVVVHKNTVGAISADYGPENDKEWECYTRNNPNGNVIYPSDPFRTCIVDDEQYPAAIYHGATDTLQQVGGGWAPLSSANGSGFNGGVSSRNNIPMEPIENPVIPMVATRDSLKTTIGVYTSDSLKQMCKDVIPKIDSSANFDIQISNDVPSTVINKWQIRPGQAAVIKMRNGEIYTNLRVLGVNINKDDDFFTVSVGAKSPTIYNEIERRTR